MSKFFPVNRGRWIGIVTLGPVHTTPEKFENAALFLRLGLPPTLVRHENGAFQKRSSNRRNLKTPRPALRFYSLDGKYLILKTYGAFQNDDITIIMGFH